MAQRVLHYTSGWEAGGVETFILNMLAETDRSRVVYDVATRAAKAGFFDDRLAELGGQKHQLAGGKNKITAFVRALKGFYSLVKNKPYPIVHIHTGVGTEYLYAVCARLAGAKTVVLHSHNTRLDHPDTLKLRWAAHNLLKRLCRGVPTHYFACSALAAGWLFAPGVFKSGKWKLINNGIPAQKYRYNPAVHSRCRAQLGLEGRVVVGHVGRFAYQKNHEFLLEIFAEMRKQNNRCTLLLVGEGPLLEDTRRKAAQLGIAQNVQFLGTRKDIPQLLQAMDVFLLPSRFEGLGVVAIEAQAAGLQVVASDMVPAVANITGNVQFLPLSAPVAQWAKTTLGALTPQRADTYETIQKRGYDAAHEANNLCAFYLGQAGRG